MSLAEQIKQRYRAADLPPVPVQAFGEALFCRHWSGKDRARWQALTFERDGKESKVKAEHYWAAAVALCLVDETGAFVFPPTGTDERGRPMHTAADVDAVADLDAPELERVYQACNAVVGIERDAVGDAEKNSVPAHSNGSPSA